MQDVTLAYDRFDPASEGLREALTSTGNGYFCTRGTAEWEDAGTVHYPGTYAHGGFNRETTILGGRPVLNEDLVNLPNWLVLKLRIEGGGRDPARQRGARCPTAIDYDIRRALVGRELCFRDLAGRETTLRSRRFVSMADSHQAGIEWILTPQNWSGRMEVVSALDGRVTNQMVARYRELEGRHLNPVSPRTFGPQTIALKVQTRQSNIYIAEAARTRVFRGDGPAVVERSLYQMEDYIQQVLAFDVTVGEPVRVEKLVALFTSHDNAITEPLAAAGPARAALPRLRRGAGRARGGMDRAVGHLRRAAAARTPRAAAAALPHRPSCCRSAPATPPGTTRASRPAGSTARPTAATCSGTSSTSTRSSTSGSRRSPAGCCSTATADCPRHGRRRGRPATGARCSRGRAAATAPRRPRSCTSTRCPGSGNPTTATTSATSTRRSSTTCGSTTRPPTTWGSSATTAPS